MRKRLDEQLRVINIGLSDFYKDLQKQGVKVIHVDWKPPKVDSHELDALKKIL